MHNVLERNGLFFAFHFLFALEFFYQWNNFSTIHTTWHDSCELIESMNAPLMFDIYLDNYLHIMHTTFADIGSHFGSSTGSFKVLFL